MSTYPIARRFRSRARLITASALAGAVVVGVGGPIAVLVTGQPGTGILVAYLVAMLVIVVMIGSFAIITIRLGRALRALAARHPGHVVFLARRLPPVVSDMPAYLRSKGIDARIGDGWYPVLVDERGIGLYRPGRDPRELVLMEWSEIGAIETVRTATVGGDSRWSVTVDVRPYDVPLTADIGDAWGIVTMPLDAIDTAAVVRAAVAKRP